MQENYIFERFLRYTLYKSLGEWYITTLEVYNFCWGDKHPVQNNFIWDTPNVLNLRKLCDLQTCDLKFRRVQRSNIRSSSSLFTYENTMHNKYAYLIWLVWLECQN
jgi:hypothetical protein